jgi:hypothetical protein
VNNSKLNNSKLNNSISNYYGKNDLAEVPNICSVNEELVIDPVLDGGDIDNNEKSSDSSIAYKTNIPTWYKHILQNPEIMVGFGITRG